jgi:hypothetical protein
MPNASAIPGLLDRAAARGTGRTRTWRRYPAKSGVRPASPKPEKYEASVEFIEAGDTLMMEVAVRNRTGSTVQFEVSIQFERSWIHCEGNSHGKALYPVGPHSNVSVRVGGSEGPILYEGKFSAEEADNGTTQPLPGGQQVQQGDDFYGGPDPTPDPEP